MVDIYVAQPKRTQALGNLALRQGLQGGPIYHPLQALGQLAQTAAGVYLSRKADQQEQQRRQQAQSALMGLLPQQMGPQTAMAGQTAMPSDVPPGPSLASLMGYATQFPEYAGIVNPMIAAQMKPQERQTERDVAGRLRYLDTGGLAFPEAEEPPRQPQSKIGKLMADRDAAIETYGADSPQVNAYNEVIRSEQSSDDPKAKLTDVAGLRKEFSSQVKAFREKKDAYRGIEAAPDTGAGDIALIYSFVRLQSPGIVSDKEADLIASTGGAGDRVKAMWEQWKSGQRLTPDQRNNLKATARAQVESSVPDVLQLEGEFRRLAEMSDMDPEQVIIDYLGEDFRPATPAAPSQEDLNADLDAMTTEELEAYIRRLDGG